MRRKLALCAPLLLAMASSVARGDPSTGDVPDSVRRRLGRTVPFQAKLSIEQGETVFVELAERIPALRITYKPSEYEARVTEVGAPRGVVVHARVDELKVESSGGQARVLFRYALHVEPHAKVKGGLARLTLSLVERKGLANVVLQKKISHRINVVSPKPKIDELAADFHGYRIHKRLALARLSTLQRAGLKGLTLSDQGKIATPDLASEEAGAIVAEFERHRRRVWIAHRHLEAAAELKDRKIAGPAKIYLAQLDKPDDQLTGLALTALPPSESKPTGSSLERSAKTGEIATLKPERVEGAEGRPTAPADSTLAPVTTYEPGTEGDDEPAPGEADAPGASSANAEAPTKDPGRKAAVIEAAPSSPERIEDDIIGTRRRGKETPIPSYARGLVLDDPNIAHSVSVRASYASLSRVRGAAGVAPAFFFQGQVAVTRSVGVELVIPTSYVNINLERAQSLYVMGNPLVAAKYRLHLPELNARRPALTIRARWAIPISPLHTIPPTQLGAEEFSFPAHFTDTYAFLLEKSDLGLGASAAWQTGMFAVGAQLYGDYFFPVANALDQTRFVTLSYGVSFGVLPFGNLFGAFLEARATSLFAGPRRTELAGYLGARGRILPWMEAALWLALPVGSVSEVSGLQVGGELRFSYDVDDALSTDVPKRRDQLLGE